jgi:hypothetical protein
VDGGDGCCVRWLAKGADSNYSERAQRQEKCLRILSIQNTNPVPVILVAPLPAGYVHGRESQMMPWHAWLEVHDDEDDEMRQTGSVHRFGLPEKIKNSKASRTPRQKVILVTLCQY